MIELAKRNAFFVGLLLLAIGLIQAAPHLAFMIEFGQSICLSGEGSPLTAMLGHAALHCWGCGVALLGAAILVGAAISAFPISVLVPSIAES